MQEVNHIQFCPDCTSQKITALNTVPIKQNGADILAPDYTLYECANCGLWFKQALPNFDRLYKMANLLQALPNQINHKKAPYDIALNKLVAKLSKGSTLLLANCNNLGLQTGYRHIHKFGIDANEKQAVLAEKNGLHILGPFLTANYLGDYKFDLIILQDVLEEMASPTNCIRTLLRHLKANGQLIIICLRTDSLACKLDGAAYWYFSTHAGKSVYLNHKYLHRLKEQLKGYEITYKSIKLSSFNFKKYCSNLWNIIKTISSHNNLFKLFRPVQKVIDYPISTSPYRYSQFKDHYLIHIKKNIN